MVLGRDQARLVRSRRVPHRDTRPGLCARRLDHLDRLIPVRGGLDLGRRGTERCDVKAL